eukprot:gene12776-26939_t
MQISSAAVVSKKTSEHWCLDKRFISKQSVASPSFEYQTSTIANEVRASNQSSATHDKEHICPDTIRSSIQQLRTDWTLNLNMSSMVCKSFSRGFPSKGGEGCPCQCSKSKSSHLTKFHSPPTSWPNDLIANIRSAQDLLQPFGDLKFSSTDKLGLVLQSHCCLTKDESAKIIQIENNLFGNNSTPFNVTVDQLSCLVTSADSPRAVSMILALDRHSSRLLYNTAQNISKQASSLGLSPSPTESRFGLVIATAANDFPCQPAIAAVNKRIAPGRWTSSGVLLKGLRCASCIAATPTATTPTSTTPRLL